MTVLHVYGVAEIDALRGIEFEGLRGEKVSRVEHGELAALVSPVPDDLEAGRGDLLAHARLLEQMTEKITVLPMQFGMEVPSEDEVRQRVVVAEYDRLKALLARFDGTVQLTVKAYHEEEAALREVLRQSPQAEGLRRRMASMPKDATYYQQIALGEQIAGLLERLRTADARSILERLAPLALGVVEEEATAMHQVINAAFLVRRDHRQAFDEGVSAVAEAMSERLRVRYVGPQPPYSFVDGPTAEAAWA